MYLIFESHSCFCFSFPLLFLWLGISVSHANASERWSEWWSYEGIAGPSYWGSVNPEWESCALGKKQSPVDINPKLLLFDPNLKHVNLEKHAVNGWLVNTGRDVSFNIDSTFKLRLFGGPLSYKYAVTNGTIHFGSKDDKGSEHTINGEHFAAEIQLIAYNYELFSTVAAARQFPSGLAIISLLVKIGEANNTEFSKISSILPDIKYRYMSARIDGILLRELLPPTESFVTYEGSMTQPGCEESVTWIVMNKPIYISKEQMSALRDLVQGPNTHPSVMPVSDNLRPVKPLHHRVLRTNINFEDPSRLCNMERVVGYKANNEDDEKLKDVKKT